MPFSVSDYVQQNNCIENAPLHQEVRNQNAGTPHLDASHVKRDAIKGANS